MAYTKKQLKDALAKRDFVAWLDYVYILEPKPDGSNARIPYEKWPHLLEAIEALKANRLIVWPKARQTGASWLIAAWVLWKTMYNLGFKSLLFSQGEVEALALLEKIVIIC